jgi:hypothetical protein
VRYEHDNLYLVGDFLYEVLSCLDHPEALKGEDADLRKKRDDEIGVVFREMM